MLFCSGMPWTQGRWSPFIKNESEKENVKHIMALFMFFLSLIRKHRSVVDNDFESCRHVT